MSNKKVLAFGLVSVSTGRLCYFRCNPHFERLLQNLAPDVVKQNRKTQIIKKEDYVIPATRCLDYIVIFVLPPDMDSMDAIPYSESIAVAYDHKKELLDFEKFLKTKIEEIEDPALYKAKEVREKLNQTRKMMFGNVNSVFHRGAIMDDEDDFEDDAEEFHHVSINPEKKTRKRNVYFCCATFCVFLCAAITYATILLFTVIVFYYILDCFGQDCVEILNANTLK